MEEKIVDLKNNIEKEINNINISYEKIINDLTKSFQEKYEKLKKEENDIKEKFENEVTKVKESLENYLLEINNYINFNEKIKKGVKKLENEEKNIMKIVSYVSAINKNYRQMNNIAANNIKSVNFSYNEEEKSIKYNEINLNEKKISVLKKIEEGICELDYGGKCQGRIMFDTNSNKIYYMDGQTINEIIVYENYNNFKTKAIDKKITLQSNVCGNYTVIHKGFFYYFECQNYPTNKLIKYDLTENKILSSKNILEDAVLGNSQNCWGGFNDIILISDNITLYAVYSSNKNQKRISIAKIDENNLNVIKIWNTDSKEKGKCGPIFMIHNILYHINSYSTQNDYVCYSYNLMNGKSSNINIPFENKGGYDSSLTYYPNLNCLMTVNNKKIYKYNIVLENEKI